MSIEDLVYGFSESNLDGYKVTSSGNVISRCPFPWHDDNTPSFTLNIHEGVFNCYGCHTAGPFQYLLKLMNSPTSVINRAAKIISEDTQDKDIKKRIRRKNERYELIEAPVIPESYLGLYDFCPTNLIEMGFKKEVLQRFEVGFDNKGYRITYPVRDHQGNLRIVYAKTILPNIVPQLVMYDHLYDIVEASKDKIIKGGYLYNLHRVYPKLLLGDLKEIVVVEGQKDCIWLWQKGVHNVVATLTSVITNRQLELLGMFDLKVILALDNDEAGQEGTLRSLGRLLKRAGIRVEIASYPEHRKDAAPEIDAQGEVKAGMTRTDIETLLKQTVTPLVYKTQTKRKKRNQLNEQVQNQGTKESKRFWR
ncbi:hypothetical protein LCGC14_0147250 [marine sediment metagenome]|uniref:Toprim domain-containing protein n=1 Tax=marine sediment metagenome TaxID=412755 RepID=A0A0F9Y1S2_9ZZZZ